MPHGWNTALGLAADFQFVAALPNARFVEYLTPCAYIEGFTQQPFELDDEGYLAIPMRPGLGVDIDEDRLASFVGDRRSFGETAS